MFAVVCGKCSIERAMTRTSKKLIHSVAEILNRHIQDGGDIAELLKDQPVRQLVNEILGENAEGGRLVSAVESDGSIVGFVPWAAVPAATPKKETAKPPAGPDEG